MSKIRKCKLSWKPSESIRVVGYRLYWSNETPVSYDSNFFKLGNTTAVNLTDTLIDAATPGESIYLGISAVDEAGNESDIISLLEPYRFSAPPAPMGLVITNLNDFKIIEIKNKAQNKVQDSQKSATQKIGQDSRPETPQSLSKYFTTE